MAMTGCARRSLLPTEGDPRMLRLVLANLLSNAIEFGRTRAPAVIAVGWRLESAEVAYFVQDNGIGFEMSTEAVRQLGLSWALLNQPARL
ncbi:MAG: hypothetical protein IT306_19670 [Chloroflexi bacterium]|nr:hypothetical protein [Chloroflexota bacterium]